MPKLQVLSCPSCGASLTVEEGEAASQCQFCGNTVIVPEELRRPAPGAMPPPPPAANLRLGGIPFLDQLPRLREMGDMIRTGRREEAVQLYRQLFSVSDSDARRAVDLMVAGQPVTVHHMSSSMSASADDSGIFRFDRLGMPQVQISTSSTSTPGSVMGTPMAGGYSGTPMAGSYTGTPVVIRSGGGNRLVGCILALVIIGVLGTIIVGALTAFGGLLPLLAIPGVGDVISEVTNTYPRVILEFGGAGTGAGTFTDARHVSIDGDGNIYVAEYTGGRVQVFDSAGQFQTQWTPEADNDIYLTGFAVSRDGDVYMTHSSELWRYEGATGELLDQIEYTDGWGFNDVAVLPEGGVVAAWYKGRDDLIFFDDDGDETSTIQEVVSSITGDLESSLKLAANGRGEIYLLAGFEGAVFHYSPEGEYQNRFGSDGDEAGQFRAMGDIAIDQQGRLYISDIKGIQVFEPDGRYLSTIRPPDFAYAYGLAFDDDNMLYVVSNETVYKYQLEADE